MIPTISSITSGVRRSSASSAPMFSLTWSTVLAPVITVDTTVTVSAFGVVTPGTELVELGSISLPLFSQSVSLGTLYPR